VAQHSIAGSPSPPWERLLQRHSLILFIIAISSVKRRYVQDSIQETTGRRFRADEGLERLKTLKATSSESQQVISAEYKDLAKFIGMIKMQINVRETKLKMRSNRLSEAETELIAALDKVDLSANIWVEARQAVEALGKKVLDTSSVQPKGIHERRTGCLIRSIVRTVELPVQ
jgi:hypothetical protein